MKHSQASAQREGCELTREYLQCSLNFPNEECHKNHHLCEETQNVRASMVYDVPRPERGSCPPRPRKINTERRNTKGNDRVSKAKLRDWSREFKSGVHRTDQRGKFPKEHEIHSTGRRIDRGKDNATRGSHRSKK